LRNKDRVQLGKKGPNKVTPTVSQHKRKSQIGQSTEKEEEGLKRRGHSKPQPVGALFEHLQVREGRITMNFSWSHSFNTERPSETEGK